VKVSVESHPKGLVICKIKKSLLPKEAALVIVGISKLLANGKARILVEFAEEAATGPMGAEYLEKVLRDKRELAKRAGGDIRYVIAGAGPGAVAARARIPGANADLETAVQAFLGESEALAKAQEAMQVELKEKSELLNKLKTENAALVQKLEELLRIVRKPSTDRELWAAVEHYKKLSAEIELEPPVVAPKKS